MTEETKTGYNPEAIEKKWQDFWEKKQIFKAEDFSRKPKIYILVEFPYPSGAGLHVGHCRSFTAMDVISRKKRMEGFNVLFPMGWDAFGLPTENYAVKTGIPPAIATEKNTASFKKQMKELGLSFDWSREILTTSPSYYKWTQWIFVQLFKKGLAYKKKMPVNWCPACKIVLANEEVIDGKCERCGEKVVKKEKSQWLLRITKYADRLIEDLDKVDYPEKVKTLQKDWIGRSYGAEVVFKIKTQDSSIEKQIKIFTTRLDTIFGVTYLVLAPEHPIIQELKEYISNFDEVKDYIEKAREKTEIERTADTKEKSGVKLEGVFAVNPVNQKEIPVFSADYVLMDYGTGAVMAVPSHDKRDFDFAKKYDLPIVPVVQPSNEKNSLSEAYEGEGVLMNSGDFNGLTSQQARERILAYLQKMGLAQSKVYYKLRDWIFSRQRYWGEPIPMIHCEECGWVPVPEKDLPVELPEIKDYKPTESGDSPLAKVEEWVNTTCPKCGKKAKRETDVMPNWAGSNWYFLRYCDPSNDKMLADGEKLRYWMPVDWYDGGMEHTTLHLLYSRFIYKFLWDIGAVPKEIGPEPYKKRTAHGMILGEGGVKMSKSKGNVVNPEDIVREYGADTLRVYEMFMGPFDQAIAWDQKGVKGVRRFLERVWMGAEWFFAKEERKTSRELKRKLHQTIKKVSEDIEAMKFNTAVSSLMEFTNQWLKEKGELEESDFGDFLKILSPFAPHLAEELYQRLQKDKSERETQSIFETPWPSYDDSLLREDRVTIILQINGKKRDELEVNRDVSEEQLKEMALHSLKIKKWIKDKEIKKVVFVKDKLINFVV